MGKDLELFHLDPTAPGMPYWLPKGMRLLNNLLEFWREEHEARGYQEISSPLINHKKLWVTSGHWDHYRDDMFVIGLIQPDSGQFGLVEITGGNSVERFSIQEPHHRLQVTARSEVEVANSTPEVKGVGPAWDHVRSWLARVLSTTEVTTLLVTHDHDEAFAIADRTAVMRAGRLVQEGPTPEVWAHPADGETALFLGYDTVLVGPAADRLASWWDSIVGQATPVDAAGTAAASARWPNIAASTGSGVCARQPGPACRMIGARSASAAAT